MDPNDKDKNQMMDRMKQMKFKLDQLLEKDKLLKRY